MRQRAQRRVRSEQEFLESTTALRRWTIAFVVELPSFRCPMFIDKLRAVDRFYEILGMVEHRQIVCANELTEKYAIS